MSRLRVSDEAVALGHMGAVFLYHQRFGYILEMSRDVYDVWAAFADGADSAAVAKTHASTLSGQSPEELITILSEFSCLVTEAGDDVADRWLDYVPVKGAWNTWIREGETVTLWTAWGARPAMAHSLDEQESRVWDAIDGALRVSELGARFGAELTQALLLRLSSIEVQAIKLSPMPLSVYGGAHRWPAYLTSTMPYPPLADGADSIPKLARYHRAIADADEQFESIETTLAHLFRHPHPALDGRNYGQALLDGLEKSGLVLGPEPLRVVEIGGGLGEMAAAMCESARARGFALDYRILELSPTLAARQRERTAGLGVEIIDGDVLSAELPSGSIDLLVSNEMIGDLPATRLAEAAELVSRYQLDVRGAEPDTPLNSGAIELLERVAVWLAPAGLAVVTEFGERSRFARMSSHLDHPEHSIHFGHLESAAHALELESELVYVIDLIEMRRELRGLATTRSQFRALQTMLSKHGAELTKIGYTSEMFAEATGAVGRAGVDFGDVRFDKIEDRLMGLVPHEFKALLIRRPRA